LVSVGFYVNNHLHCLKATPYVRILKFDMIMCIMCPKILHYTLLCKLSFVNFDNYYLKNNIK